jgi:hypothetical protein
MKRMVVSNQNCWDCIGNALVCFLLSFWTITLALVKVHWPITSAGGQKYLQMFVILIDRLSPVTGEVT